MAYLVTHDKTFTIRVPSQSEGITETFHLIDDGFGSYIPELDDPITVTESAGFSWNKKNTNLETLHSSASLTGLNATFSIGAA